MFCKVLLVCAVVTICQAGLVHHAPAVSSQNIYRHDQSDHHSALVVYAAPSAPVHVAPAQPAPELHDHHDEFAHSQYAFSYSVGSPHTGDHKSQQEKRVGDSVVGQYSLLQPDGIYRTVTYTADHKHGFNAVVRNTPTIVHYHP